MVNRTCRPPRANKYYTILNPSGQNVRQGQNPLPDISRSLSDMSDIFREDWVKTVVFDNLPWPWGECGKLVMLSK